MSAELSRAPEASIELDRVLPMVPNGQDHTGSARSPTFAVVAALTHDVDVRAKLHEALAPYGGSVSRGQLVIMAGAAAVEPRGLMCDAARCALGW